MSELYMSCQDKIDQHASCRCCITHGLNKPKIYAPWVETEWPGPRRPEEKAPTGGACQCDCRHQARFLCRDLREKLESRRFDYYGAEMDTGGVWEIVGGERVWHPIYLVQREEQLNEDKA